MKKSKIILPAIALLTISTVAAASSTVAWFTANRTVDVNLSQVAVYNPESNLEVTLKEDTAAGTSVNNTKGAQIVTLPSYMRDGSVDAAAKKVYKKDVVTGEYSAITGYSTDTATIAEKEEKIYRATHWTMTFSMKEPSTNDYGVLLDMNKTKFTVGASENGAISKSFRVAFVVNDIVSAVIAPFADDDAVLTYVSKEGKDAQTTSYTNKRVATKTKEITTSEVANENDFTAAKGFVGKIESTKDLTVECYAWFEGEDANCIVPTTGLINTTITSLLSFYAVRVTTAA